LSSKDVRLQLIVPILIGTSLFNDVGNAGVKCLFLEILGIMHSIASKRSDYFILGVHL
jgi:hypothetical protein